VRLSNSTKCKGRSSFHRPCMYYRKFVKGSATIAKPVTCLTSKQTRFEWTPEAQVAFEALKDVLMEATSLAFPIPNVPCILDIDASKVAVGAVLSQKLDGTKRPITFFWRVMSKMQKKYCTTRKELLFVQSNTFVIISSEPKSSFEWTTIV